MLIYSTKFVSRPTFHSGVIYLRILVRRWSTRFDGRFRKSHSFFTLSSFDLVNLGLSSDGQKLGFVLLVPVPPFLPVPTFEAKVNVISMDVLL